MPFESLSFRYRFQIENFPKRWLPLIHLYDPDLPLFPLYYFHTISTQLQQNQRPNYSERIFGYIEKINLLDDNSVDVYVITNKDLYQNFNNNYRLLAENEIKERLGLNNSVRLHDVSNAFLEPIHYANPILVELWNRVVSDTYDNCLPYGRLWDEVLGLTRFVASWNSPSGRKGELIQTHYFCSKYGEAIQSGGGLQHIDFYLLPTISELTDQKNPLNIFPKYSSLIEVANKFQENNCSLREVGDVNLSKFNNPFQGKLNTEGIINLLHRAYIPLNIRHFAIECFNTFDKGPQRTVIFLLMLSDIRNGRLNPTNLSNETLGSIYDGLSGTYQSPKVIHIYTQQSFGNPSAIPIDIWIDTFFQWPLNLYKNFSRNVLHQQLFNHSVNLGKVERLIWVAAQARKVHSSACNDAIWCTKYSSNRKPRGANPLSCRICLSSIRNVCPAYEEIKNKEIAFNSQGTAEQFSIVTSANDNVSIGQQFLSCSGFSIYDEITDDFSSSDDSTNFSPYPSQGHHGEFMTVENFINTY